MINKLQEVRAKKNISQQTLSKMAGVARSHIEAIENFTANPTIEVVCKLANALDVKGCDIFECDAHQYKSL